MALSTHRRTNNLFAVDETGVRFTSPEEGRALFDRQARALVGMSGEEFIRRWDAGDFRDVADTPGHFQIMRLVSLMPFGRQDT
jgi:hypothetical protein